MTELALIEGFKRDKQSLQSRIRHMEAYFHTPSPATSLHWNNDREPLHPQREYGKEHRERLRQKHHELATIDSLHESRIKVLRDTQAKNYEDAIKRWEQALRELQDNNTRKICRLKDQFHEEKSSIVAWLETKRIRLQSRWSLEERIIRKRLELDTQASYAPLPEISFGDVRDGNVLPACQATGQQSEILSHKALHEEYSRRQCTIDPLLHGF